MDTTNSVDKRKGKWSVSEEAYAKKLIFAFKSGLITPVESDGRSLRSFLSNRLKCSPMRISKKFVGFEGLGSRFYARPGVTEEAILVCKREISELESKFIRSEEALQARRERRKRYINSDVSKSSDAQTVWTSSTVSRSDNNDSESIEKDSQEDDENDKRIKTCDSSTTAYKDIPDTNPYLECFLAEIENMRGNISTEQEDPITSSMYPPPQFNINYNSRVMTATSNRNEESDDNNLQRSWIF